MRKTLAISVLSAAVLASPACSSKPAAVANPLSARLSGKSCALWRDERAIPHVRGATELEAFACMGYVHAVDRAWQMDELRRAAQGRRADVWGWPRVKTDFVLRLIGLAEKAKTLFDGLPADQQELLWAYAHGVNRGFAQAMREGVYEFQARGYEPEPWQPWDTASLLLLQAFDQTRQTFERDFKELAWQQAHTEDASRLFDPDGTPWDTSILKKGEYRADPKHADRSNSSLAPQCPRLEPSPALERREASSLWAALFPDRATGSNNWVVAPSRSLSRKAWMANDPHLELKYPPFWHWVHVEGGGIDAIGASLPGVPVIASGANRYLSWGLTNAFLDAGDIAVVEEKDLQDAVSFRPRIDFKWGPFKLPMVFKSFRRTKEGWPVLPVEAPGSKGVPVLRWAGLELKPQDLAPLFSLMKARSAAEADATLALVGLPTWNFVFADAQGKVGYRAVGKIPKKQGLPRFGAGARDRKELGERTFIPAEEMPHVLNPPRGFVVTANNRQWPADSIVHAGRAHSPAFRGYRIEELLQATPQHDLDSLKRVQCDIQATDARFLLPRLLRLVDRVGFRSKNEREAARMNSVRTWDYETGPRCTACAIYRRWTDRLHETGGFDDVALYRKLVATENVTGGDSGFEAFVVRELIGALTDLEGHPDIAWENVHRLDFPHQSGDPTFAAEGIWTPGDTQAVNPGKASWDPEAKIYRHTSGASQRLIVEMTSPPTVYSILPGPNRDEKRPRDAAEQDGNPWVDWRDCKLEKRAFPLDWEKIDGAGKIEL